MSLAGRRVPQRLPAAPSSRTMAFGLAPAIVGERKPLTSAMIHLALDVGEKRIGVAVSDETETLASPRTIIRRA